MYALALDTTTRDGSVALVDDDRTIDERRGDAARSHAERLPEELVTLATAHLLAVSAVDLFAVASGPGSFTGLRIGIATVQGLALTAGRRIVAVSALEALAQTAAGVERAGTYVAAWMNARRGEVFAALYRVAAAPAFSAERLVELEGPTVGDPASTLRRWGDRLTQARVVFVGDGATLYADAIAARASVEWTVGPEPLLAGTIGRMAIVRARRGETIGPAAVQPLYIRRPDAEIERERKTVAEWSIERLTSAFEIDDVIAIEEASFTNPWTREMYVAELERPDVAHCYLARNANRRVIGFCSVWRVVDELHINNLAVLPGDRRHGVATALLLHVLREGRRLGAVRATLEVRTSNDAARALYERMGFSVGGLRRAYYSKPVEDAVVLWRDGLEERPRG